MSSNVWAEVNKEKMQAWREARRDEKRAYDASRRRDQYLADPEKYKAASKARYAANPNPEGQKARVLRRKYGLSIAQYESMIEFQAGLCNICCEPMRPGTGTHVDHCHATGRVRGLLCLACNIRLGPLENEDFRTRAEQYLKGRAA